VSISVNQERAAANDRLTAIRLTMLTMRCMERWRRNVSDYDKAMILVSVVAITAERLTRGTLDDDMKALSQPVPLDALAPCNVSSIAAATGLNRETTRRKVKALVDEGFLVRSEQGVISFTPGHFQQDYIHDLIRSQLDSLVRTANDLIRDGTLDTDR
jgi:predicted transcriptional regulator